MPAKPLSNEYPEYYFQYTDLVPEEDIIAQLEDQISELISTFGTLSEERLLYRYAIGKWSAKEIVGHLVDAERNLVNRAFRFARLDDADIPQFDENDYVLNAGFDRFPVDDLLYQFELERKGTVALFNSFSDEEWLRSGTAGGKKFTVRAFPFILAGHVLHHLKVFNERYSTD